MARHQDLDDEALCGALARGDEAALRVLIERWGARLRALLVRASGSEADADDLFQELWLRVVRAAPTFDPSLRFSAWVHRIAMNLAHDHHRRTRASGYAAVTAEGELPDGADPSPDPEARAASAGSARALHQAIAELPKGQREVLTLRYLEGLPEREVAEVAGIPPGTVKSRLHHAMRSLRARLAAEEVA